MGLSIRKYATLRGVTEGAVRKAISSGRITPNEDGTIDAERADREWKENTDEAKINTGLPVMTENMPAANGKPSFTKIKTAHELYKAQLTQLHCMPRGEVMQHFINNENLAILVKRQSKRVFSYAFLVNKICESCVFESAYANNTVLPLYLYEENMGKLEKRPNLDPKIYAQIKSKISHVTPESLFDYIYAVLHSPTYRDRYAEFLKSDFPRIPYPSDVNTFNALAEQGGKLRALHLMESDALDELVTTYPISGDNIVNKPKYKDGDVYINETQYFGDVPKMAWEFYIGGYQPAQKWLKDRKGRELSVDDIMHYQRIIVALTETDNIMPVSYTHLTLPTKA